MNYKVVARTVLAVWLMCSGYAILKAQSFFPGQDGEHCISAGIEAEAGMLFSVGYQRSFHVEPLRKNIGVFANATIPSGDELLNDLRIKLGAQTFLLPENGYTISAGIALTGIHSNNDLISATGFGLDLILTAGYYGSAWFAAAEAGMDRTFISSITFTDYYREYFYEGARDGWYDNTAGNLRLGARGGIRTGRTELALRTGLQTTLALNNRVLPFYAGLSAGYRL